MKTEKASAAEEPTLDISQESAKTNAPHAWLKSSSKPTRKQTIITCSIIFFVAFGCRLLSWQDNRFEARKVQTQVTEGYKHTGRLLQKGGISSFYSADSPLADPNHLGHPPGYPILIAVVFSIYGESDSALQIIQILADAAAAVVLFLIALALFKRTIATIAGLLVALAPQFTYNSVLLLPDSLAVLPLLLAVYFLIRARKRPRLIMFIAAGALVGLSCWLRANVLLLVPFMTLLIPILFERGRRARYALALVFGLILIIAPLTIRNYLVYGYFVPVSLGAGQTLLEGIADYDTSGSLGIPNTDMGLMKWEAEFYKRPDYFGTLFNPDGVWRDRERIKRGFAVMRSHPFWFFGVMARRGAAMLKLERVRLISADPPVTHSLNETNETPPAWSSLPSDLLATGKVASAQAEVSLSPDDQSLHITGDASKYDNQFISAPMTVERNSDYILRLPVRIEQGRMIVSIVGAGSNTQYTSAIIEPQDWKTPTEQVWNTIEMPFVSGSADQVQIVFANGGSKDSRPVMQVGQTQLYALGPAAFTWTRIPRALVQLIQKLFVTAVMLPLAIIGLLLLILARQRRTIALLLVIPVYYLCVQSALHTEYRYVLAIHYFLFVFVAVAIYWAGSRLWRVALKIPFLELRATDDGSVPPDKLDG
jgi:hypothetical protein